MKNNWIVTPAFCKADLLDRCLNNIHRSPTGDKISPPGFTHVVIDGHYPVNKAENRVEIQKLCQYYGCVYLDPGRDLGLHGNLNYAMNTLNVSAEDGWVGVDPDDFPVPGSIQKLVAVMEMNRTIAVLGLSFDVIYQRIKEGKLQLHQVGPHLVYYHPTVEMFKVAAFNLRFIKSLPQGFHEERNYYGGIEAYLHGQWLRQGLRLAYLPESCENVVLDKSDPYFCDPEYRLWKDDHLAGYPHSFEQWLTERK